MKRGQLGEPSSNFSRIDTSSFPIESKKRGKTIRKALTTGQGQKQFNGDTVVEGRAAVQDVRDVQTTDINNNGDIVSGGSRLEVVTDSADFFSVNGRYVVTESTQQQFVFDLVGRATRSIIEPYSVNLHSLVNANPDANYRVADFHDLDGGVDKTAMYGDDTLSDERVKLLIEDGTLNRLSIEFADEGRDFHVMITKGAYVEVYQPSNFNTLEFKELLDNLVVPHLH